MSLFRFLLRSRGVRNLLPRAKSLVERFEFSPSKYLSILNYGLDLCQKYGAKLCLPTTAIVLARYPKVIRNLQDNGVELAIHGFVHIDYKQLQFSEQLEHFVSAIELFNKYEIKFSGFRAPYTRANADTMRAIQKLGFQWDSSKTVLWGEEVIRISEYQSIRVKAYKKALDLYNPVSASLKPILPELIDGVVEIPVVLPDDEMLVDRLGLSKEEVKSVWLKILSLTYERGELFTLQIHPERFKLLGDAVEAVLKSAVSYNPPIWLASLNEIAEWWRCRSRKSVSPTTPRWPHGARACLSITGDIDAITLFDFLMRIFRR